MKLYYLSNLRIPTEKAHGIQIAKMCEAFALNGLDVELIAPVKFNKIDQDPYKYYNVKKNFKITKLFCLDTLRFFHNKISFFIQTIIFLISARIFLSFKQKGVLYTREIWAGLFFSGYVVEIHSLPKRINWLVLRGLRQAGRLLVLTDFLKKEIAALGIDQNKIFVSPDGVDLKNFDIDIGQGEARKMVGLPADKKIILYSGSFYLYDWKGVDVLLDTAKYLSDNELIVLLGGQAEEISQIKRRGPSDRVLLIERQSYKKIPVYLKAADTLVLPNKKGDSMSEKYTSPLKLFEYMASQRPIVASDLFSIREILNENNSILVESDNPASLAEGIKKALEDNQLASQISGQALKDVQQYSWQKRAEKIIEFINFSHHYGK
ncbi:MAG: glycosyltransferase family 4 protein [Patescibacteria group bacterium]|nr:glycosyltransferase family 4 protein [Patescibacteria group bacterium]